MNVVCARCVNVVRERFYKNAQNKNSCKESKSFLGRMCLPAPVEEVSQGHSSGGLLKRGLAGKMIFEKHGGGLGIRERLDSFQSNGPNSSRLTPNESDLPLYSGRGAWGRLVGISCSSPPGLNLWQPPR